MLLPVPLNLDLVALLRDYLRAVVICQGLGERAGSQELLTPSRCIGFGCVVVFVAGCQQLLCLVERHVASIWEGQFEHQTVGTFLAGEKSLMVGDDHFPEVDDVPQDLYFRAPGNSTDFKFPGLLLSQEPQLMVQR